MPAESFCEIGTLSEGSMIMVMAALRQDLRLTEHYLSLDSPSLSTLAHNTEEALQRHLQSQPQRSQALILLVRGEYWLYQQKVSAYNRSIINFLSHKSTHSLRSVDSLARSFFRTTFLSFDRPKCLVEAESSAPRHSLSALALGCTYD